MTAFDAAVLGVGVMGSAVAHALAQRGARVVAFDQHAPPHTLGSSHGRTRIIREAYYEHPLYVPLVQRAYERWRALEAESAQRLFVQTGGLMVGPERGPLFRGALQSALAHNIAHEVLGPADVRRLFPAYLAASDSFALYEKRAGMLFPESCIAAQLDRAASLGCAIHLDECVKGWSSSAGGLTITTNRGSYSAERLVIAAGPWLPQIAEATGIALPLEIERQLSHWFEPERGDKRYDATECPVALWEMPDGDVFATLPNTGDGVKCGMHHSGAPTSPETVNRTVSQGENAVARELLETVMPGAGGRLKESRVCLYTNTPDRHFLIDWIDSDQVLLVSACSGHGFKFASAIGEVVSQLLLDGKSWLDIRPFSLARFGARE